MSQRGNAQSGGFGGAAQNNLSGFGGGVNTGLNQSNPFSVNTGGATGAGAGGGNSWLSFDSAFGGTNAQGQQSTGWASPALGAATGLAQSWLGFQNLGVAKDQLSFQKSAWQDQFNIQKEEYEYQKNRRSERQANYEASLSNNRNSVSSNV